MQFSSFFRTGPSFPTGTYPIFSRFLYRSLCGREAGRRSAAARKALPPASRSRGRVPPAARLASTGGVANPIRFMG